MKAIPFLQNTILVLIIGMMLIPFFAFAQEETNSPLTNVGFLEQPIWYSKDPFFAGDSIKIHTLLFNSSDSTVRGTMEFFDGITPLGRKPFTVSPNGGTTQVSFDWTATAGSHRISARIVEAYQNGDDLIEIENDNSGYDDRSVKNPTPTERDTALIDKVEGLTNSVTDKVPEPVSRATEEATRGIEKFRDKKANTMQEKIDEFTLDIDAMKEAETKRKEAEEAGVEVAPGTPEYGEFDKPFKQIGRFFLKIGHFIFKVKALFYIISIVLLVVILRYLYRKIFDSWEYY